jgi:hypothetical protein
MALPTFTALFTTPILCNITLLLVILLLTIIMGILAMIRKVFFSQKRRRDSQRVYEDRAADAADYADDIPLEAIRRAQERHRGWVGFTTDGP